MKKVKREEFIEYLKERVELGVQVSSSFIGSLGNLYEQWLLKNEDGEVVTIIEVVFNDKEEVSCIDNVCLLENGYVVDLYRILDKVYGE